MNSKTNFLYTSTMDKKTADKIIAQTIADYNLIATKFSSTRSKLSPDLVELAQLADENGLVLDYGCGNGRFCQLFAKDRYLGADASQELIKIARVLHPEYEFTQVEPGKMPTQDKFSTIFCLSMIHHLPDKTTHKALLDNFLRSLLIGGRLILTSWYLDGQDHLLEVPFKDDSTQITRQIFSFSKENLESLIHESGFEINKSSITPRNRGRYSNIEIVAQKTI